MNFALLLGVLSSVLFGAGDYAGGRAARHDSAPLVTAFSGLAAVLVLLVGLPFVPGTPSAADLAWAAGAGVCGAGGATLIYRSLAMGPASVASPTFCIIGLTTPVLFGILIGERPSAIAWVGVALAAVSLVPLAWGGGEQAPADRAHVRRTFAVAAAAGGVIGGFLICVARIGAGAGLWPLVVGRLTSITILGAGLVLARRPLVPVAAARRPALVAGALDSSANLLYWFGVQGAPIALMAALVSLAPATTVLLSRALLGERWSAAQKFGLALALFAGVLIAYR